MCRTRDWLEDSGSCDDETVSSGVRRGTMAANDKRRTSDGRTDVDWLSASIRLSDWRTRGPVSITLVVVGRPSSPRCIPCALIGRPPTNSTPSVLSSEMVLSVRCWNLSAWVWSFSAWNSVRKTADLRSISNCLANDVTRLVYRVSGHFNS